LQPCGVRYHPHMDDLTALHEAILTWFEEHKTEPPWRGVDAPYMIWLAEIMLQQTQIATVVPYYERFIDRFPTVEALADAPLDDILKLWEGLGYYSRARNMHRAAKMIVDEFSGELPRTVEGLRKLPGVGPYTAGAVGSIAFGLDAPVVDGNVIRVLARLFDIDDDVRSAGTKRALWEIAGEILPQGRAGEWNQGVMELGQRICTPRGPRCDICPAAPFCEARKLGIQEERPVKSPKKRAPHYDVTAGVIRGVDGRILIAQRPLDGLLGGLWEFPGGKREPGESLAECLRREVEEELAIQVEVGPQIVVVKHAYSHFRITLYAYACEHSGGEAKAVGVADFEWVTPEELERYAFPVTDQQIIAALNGGGQMGMDLDVVEGEG
jgi:A/G-specific adenine glycosylase